MAQGSRFGHRTSTTAARGQGGFTLVELIVTIAVLALLAGIAMFAAGGATDEAQRTACRAERRVVRTAVEGFRVSTGGYPTSDASTSLDGRAFIPGFLDVTPSRVVIGYAPTPATGPSYSWAAACTGLGI